MLILNGALQLMDSVSRRTGIHTEKAHCVRRAVIRVNEECMLNPGGGVACEFTDAESREIMGMLKALIQLLTRAPALMEVHPRTIEVTKAKYAEICDSFVWASLAQRDGAIQA